MKTFLIDSISAITGGDGGADCCQRRLAWRHQRGASCPRSRASAGDSTTPEWGSTMPVFVVCEVLDAAGVAATVVSHRSAIGEAASTPKPAS